jgi:hypothetical protein
MRPSGNIQAAAVRITSDHIRRMTAGGPFTCAQIGPVVIASFVLSSRSDLGIRSSRQLGIVPYGDGEAVVLHDGTEANATITTHCLGKHSRTESLPIRNGLLHVPLREQLENGSVVEWLQIDFS